MATTSKEHNSRIKEQPPMPPTTPLTTPNKISNADDLPYIYITSPLISLPRPSLYLAKTQDPLNVRTYNL